jgi:acyl-CoA oxidase
VIVAHCPFPADNGFLLLNNVEIPHVNMLARFARVDKETNKYVKPPSSALTYGTMTWVRANIVLDAGSTLARGTTISLRYCAVRRQFQDKDAQPGADESPVLDYTMVQYRLFSCLASAFAMHFTGQAMMRLYAQKQEWVNNNSDIKGKPDVGKLSSTERGPGPEEVNAGADILADLHATSCGLKALASITAGEGLEVCRRACGGHGYSSFSGIGTYYADYLPTLTWEGDSYMITQQVARYVSLPPVSAFARD